MSSRQKNSSRESFAIEREVSRPLSPYLQIYKLQITSALSMLHRFSELILYGGIVFFSLFLIFSLGFGSGFSFVHYTINALFGKILVALWVVGIVFNILSGVRHLFWDMASGLSLGTIYTTAYLILGATFLISVAVLVYVFKGLLF